MSRWRLAVPGESEFEAAGADLAIGLDQLGVAAARDGGTIERSGTTVRRFLGGDTVRLALDGPFDLRAYGRLIVRLSGPAGTNLTARLQVLRPSGRVVTDPRELTLTGEPLDVPLDLPVAVRTEELVERIRIVLPLKDIDSLEVHAVRFEHAFTSALLRSGSASGDSATDPATGAPPLVDLGGDARPARPLRGGTLLAALGDATGADSFELDVAFTPPLRPAPDARLVVRWSGDDDLELARLTPGRGAPWETVTVPFDAGSPGRLTVAIEGAEDGFALVGEPRFRRAQERPPTVLLITSDTHRADHLAVAPGSVEVRTPGLDALAERGLLFANAQSSTNVTVPSHAALLSGVSPKDTGVRDNRSAIAAAAPTLAEAFRSAGWATFAVVGVDILADGHSRLGQGFDRMSAPVGTRSAGEGVRRLLDWLPDAEGVPLFCWLHVYDAHRPYEPPRVFVDGYWDAERDPRDPTLPDPATLGFRMPKAHPDVRDPDYLNALYKAEVSSLDRELTRLLETARVADGVIGFTADHGECLGVHGTWTHRELTPHTLRVPLVVSWPDGPRGDVEARPVDHLGLGRTLLDLVGLGDAPFAGDNLLASEGTEPLFALGGDARSASVTSQGHYLALHLEDHQFVEGQARYKRHAVELYDLATDPDCLVDVQAERPDVARELRSVLVAWLTSGGARGWLASRTDDAQVLDQLAQLGYLYGEDSAAAAELLIEKDCGCERCLLWR